MTMLKAKDLKTAADLLQFRDQLRGLHCDFATDYESGMAIRISEHSSYHAFEGYENLDPAHLAERQMRERLHDAICAACIDQIEEIDKALTEMGVEVEPFYGIEFESNEANEAA